MAESIKYIDKALAISSNDTFALNSKGYSLSNMGNYAGAIEYYDKVLAMNPNDTYALTAKGNVLSIPISTYIQTALF